MGLLIVLLLIIVVAGVVIYTSSGLFKALSVLRVDYIEFSKRLYGTGSKKDREASTWEFVIQCIHTQERLLIYKIKKHIRSAMVNAPEETRQKAEQEFEEVLDRDDCLMRLSPEGRIEFFTISAQDKKSGDIFENIFEIFPNGPDELIQRAKEIWDAKLVLAAVCGQKEYYLLVS